MARRPVIALSAALAAMAGAIVYLTGSAPGGSGGPVTFHNDLGRADCCLAIAHAGGAVDGRPYTNSREALDRNRALGRRVFELDFLQTTDGALVLAHDWDRLGGTALGRAEFLSRPSGLTRMDLAALTGWLDACPDCTVVTDAKDDFAAFLDVLRDGISPRMMQRQFVLQVYSLAEARAVAAELPGQRMIFTAYRSPKLGEDALAELAAIPGLVGFTMPVGRVEALLPAVRAAAPDLPVYVHGHPEVINDPGLHRALAAAGISGFYLE